MANIRGRKVLYVTAQDLYLPPSSQWAAATQSQSIVICHATVVLNPVPRCLKLPVARDQAFALPPSNTEVSRFLKENKDMGSMLTDIATPAEKPLGNMTHPKGGGDALGNVASSVPPMMHECPAQSRARPREGLSCV